MEHFAPLGELLDYILFQTGEGIPIQARMPLGVAKDHYLNEPTLENKQKLNKQIGNIIDFIDADLQTQLMQVHKPWNTSNVEGMAALYRLWVIGKEAFDQGKYAQAVSIQDILKQLLQGPNMPSGEEIQIVLIPDGKVSDELPQAFKGQQQQCQIDDKIEDFSQRLQISNTITKLVTLADKLDDTGKCKEATKIDEFLKKIAQEHDRVSDPIGWQEWQHMEKERPESGESRWRNQGEKPEEVFFKWLMSEFPRKVVELQMDLFDLLSGSETAPVGMFMQDNPNAVKAPGAFEEVRDAWKEFSSDIDMMNILSKRIREVRGSRTKRLIEKLSNTGHGKQAQELLKTSRDVEEELCRECNTFYLQDVDAHERGCPNCARSATKDPWGTGKAVPVRPMHDNQMFGKPPRRASKDEHSGKPDKVVEIADAIRRDHPDTSDESAYKMAWETFCSYVEPEYEGCTEKGKSKRKS